jgi:hypothetical protein
LRVGHAYLAEYLHRIFTNALDVHEGCFGAMRLDEAVWLSERGGLVNATPREAAARNGWTNAATFERFRHHGYCASVAEETMYRSLHRSLFQQGDRLGTAHPNHRGHNAITKDMRRAVERDVNPIPVTRLAVRAARVRVRNPGDGWNGTANFGLDWWRSACGHATETVSGLAPDAWNDVCGNPCLSYVVRTTGHAFGVDASTRLGNSTHQDEADFDRCPGVTLTADRIHRRSSGFDAAPYPAPDPFGAQRLSSPVTQCGASLEVEYRIAQEPVILPPTPR